MPELPEVETIRCLLEPRLKNQIVKNVWSDSRCHLNLPLKKYQQLLKNKKIISVDRSSKLLIIKFTQNYYLAVHLKMTGQLIFNGKSNKHTHFRLDFKSGDILYFNDVRRFGYAKLFTESQMKLELDKLDYGVEPLEKEFTEEYLHLVIKKYPNRPIKQILMDQKLIAGIGNIYADESLFGARILPSRKSRHLSANEIKRLHTSIQKVLRRAIECGGSSISDYVNPLGVKGSYGDEHKVYARGGEECYTCKTVLISIKLGGRTATFCEKCQR